MSVLDFFRRKPEPQAMQSIRRSASPTKATKYGSDKYGPIRYGAYVDRETTVIRERSRGAYHESTIAHGMAERLTDTVINTGLTFESSPIWDLIPGAPQTEEQHYQKTQEIEHLFNLWSNSKEPDHHGLLTFGQLQRLAYRTSFVDGEVTAIIRYRNALDRISPVAVQLLNADHISTPYNNAEVKAVESRGGRIQDGIEYDASGEAVALYYQEDYTKKHVRIAFKGPRSGRTFVVRHMHIDEPGQSRGFPELDSIVYELSRLTEYDIAELEAVVASAAWMASIETDTNAPADPKAVKFKPNLPQRADTAAEREYGTTTVDTGKFALIQNTLEPGQTMKMFTMTRPNPNYSAFVDAFESRLAGAIGMPLSVLRQKFEGSYSSARAEILFFWMNVQARRKDFADGFLNPIYEAVFTEWVRAGEITANGYLGSKKVRLAWLAGSWNGINRPNVDPLKEVAAIERRERLGHTTKEREAKAYNGSDYRENIERLKTENALIADVNEPLRGDPQNGGRPRSTERREE